MQHGLQKALRMSLIGMTALVVSQADDRRPPSHPPRPPLTAEQKQAMGTCLSGFGIKPPGQGTPPNFQDPKVRTAFQTCAKKVGLPPPPEGSDAPPPPPEAEGKGEYRK